LTLHFQKWPISPRQSLNSLPIGAQVAKRINLNLNLSLIN
jgi:hypothetical protein